VLVLIAALNEEKGISQTISELRKYVPYSRLVVVDGNSTDRTAFIAKSLGADLYFQKGTGKGDAISYALKAISGGDYKYIVMIDADYTYPAKYVPQMVDLLEKQPSIGMVGGNRFNSHLKTEAMHNAFYMGNRFLAFTHGMFNRVAMRDPLTGLRAMRWNLLKNWSPKSSGFDIEVELNSYIERTGYEIAEIEINYRARLGEKKLKLKHGFTILKRIVFEAYLIP
jgi:dolichol-phosphate hexosyltransferase